MVSQLTKDFYEVSGCHRGAMYNDKLADGTRSIKGPRAWGKAEYMGIASALRKKGYAVEVVGTKSNPKITYGAKPGHIQYRLHVVPK